MKSECLAGALDSRTEWGIWGGMSERERRALLHRRPNVTSWRRLLEAAMAHHANVPADRPPRFSPPPPESQVAAPPSGLLFGLGWQPTNYGEDAE